MVHLMDWRIFFTICFWALSLLNCDQRGRSSMSCDQELILASFDLESGVINKVEFDQRVTIIALKCNK